jgi:hypothetical protein
MTGTEQSSELFILTLHGRNKQAQNSSVRRFCTKISDVMFSIDLALLRMKIWADVTEIPHPFYPNTSSLYVVDFSTTTSEHKWREGFVNWRSHSLLSDSEHGDKNYLFSKNHSLPFNIKVKICGAVPPLHHYTFMASTETDLLCLQEQNLSRCQIYAV